MADQVELEVARSASAEEPPAPGRLSRRPHGGTVVIPPDRFQPPRLPFRRRPSYR
ncbi:hypothetical protein AKJ08_2901 [Vulgatibacter incomptus]|uniref:Uncharacterized protein n=1 Tax=Vulgatibacter incomptus TaxID=1391653 RepID=A0A0K1PHB5_9BACT|nr:hypothetical protein AKJ08_2901 [Vulgatibacter incomptus]